jgi:hypothetical protein
MLIPYVPGCLGHLSLQRWINEAHATYIKKSLQAMLRWRAIRVDPAQQAFTQTFVGKQSLTVIGEVLRFGHGFTDFLASSLFNIMVLAWLLPGDLAIGYTISMVACTITLIFLRKPIDRLATRQEHCHINYATHLTQAWDNTVIGNVHHYDRWAHGHIQTSTQYYLAAMRTQTVQSMGNILLSTLMLLPSIYLIISTLNSPSLIPIAAAALITNLTRIFHVLSGMTALVNEALACGATFARARVLFEGWPALTPMQYPSDGPGALALPLFINGKAVSWRHAAMDVLAAQRAGRYTIQAPNGAGKTTFLKALKFKLGDSGFYLPAHAEGLAWAANVDGMSTGQKMISHLAEIDGLSDISHILLDEWDANLDDKNTALFDQRLDSTALSKVVIEVRHSKTKELMLGIP